MGFRRSQMWAQGDFVPTSLRIHNIPRHHQHFCSSLQYSFLFHPTFSMLFLSPPLATRERSFLFKAFMSSQLSPATSPTSLVDFIPFCTSSMSREEYTAFLKLGKRHYRGERERAEEMYVVCLTLQGSCTVLEHSGHLLREWKLSATDLSNLKKQEERKWELSSLARLPYLSPWFLPLWNDSLSEDLISDRCK